MRDGTNAAVAPAIIFFIGKSITAEQNVLRTLNGIPRCAGVRCRGPKRNALTGVALGIIADISSPGLSKRTLACSIRGKGICAGTQTIF